MVGSSEKWNGAGPAAQGVVRRHTTSDEQAISVFCKNESSEVFHTYSCHGRGIDMVNRAYQFLDLGSKGRDADGFSVAMTWVHRHDRY
jgi:predicted dithiol-disulfide oxidoreductase (DUF899 family)